MDAWTEVKDFGTVDLSDLEFWPSDPKIKRVALLPRMNVCYWSETKRLQTHGPTNQQVQNNMSSLLRRGALFTTVVINNKYNCKEECFILLLQYSQET